MLATLDKVLTAPESMQAAAGELAAALSSSAEDDPR